MFNNSDFDLILNDFNNNKNSHSYIFYTNDFFACRNDINNLVKKIFSVEEIDEVLSDFIVISSDDKKNILKDDVYRLKELFQNKSYLNKKRIYLIEEAHKLNPTSANMILKFLEEPSPGVVGLFITMYSFALQTLSIETPKYKIQREEFSQMLEYEVVTKWRELGGIVNDISIS